MIQKIISDFGKAQPSGNGRGVSDAVPFQGSIAAAPSGRNSSPAEPLQAQVQMPTGGTIPYAQARAQVAQAPAYQAPSGGGGGYAPPSGGGAPAAPAAPAGPVHGGRQWYNSLDSGQQQATQDSYLGGDSDYTAQMGEYDHALTDFITRITNQKQNFDTDAGHATDANNKNQQLSADQLGMDFGARGMSYSGLVDKSMNQLNDRYTEQGKNIVLQNDRNKSDADNRQADFSAQNGIDRGNAKRAALGRMAQQQALTDSSQVF